MSTSMHETTDIWTSNLFPPPLEGVAEGSFDGPGPIRMHGYCAPFCDIDGPANGMSIDDHGTACESRTVGAVHCVNSSNQRDAIYVGLHQLYTHGIYPPLVEASRTGYARLHFDSEESDDGLDGLFLTSGEVRVLAAQLVAAADILDRVGQPVGKKRAR